MKTSITRSKEYGFTLIEVIIYLSLFGILFLGAVAGAYSILESTGKNYTRAMMQEEGEFMLAKINWAITNASTALVPSERVLTSTVSGIDLNFSQDGDDLVLKRGDKEAEKLNSGAVSIYSPNLNSSLYFQNISSADGTLRGIAYGFDLIAKTADGKELVSSFDSTAYLRK